MDRTIKLSQARNFQLKNWIHGTLFIIKFKLSSRKMKYTGHCGKEIVERIISAPEKLKNALKA